MKNRATYIYMVRQGATVKIYAKVSIPITNEMYHKTNMISKNVYSAVAWNLIWNFK
jgi:hypothetical protein